LLSLTSTLTSVRRTLAAWLAGYRSAFRLTGAADAGQRAHDDFARVRPLLLARVSAFVDTVQQSRS
jgi:hypothetical protein